MTNITMVSTDNHNTINIDSTINKNDDDESDDGFQQYTSKKNKKKNHNNTVVVDVEKGSCTNGGTTNNSMKKKKTVFTKVWSKPKQQQRQQQRSTLLVDSQNSNNQTSFTSPTTSNTVARTDPLQEKNMKPKLLPQEEYKQETGTLSQLKQDLPTNQQDCNEENVVVEKNECYDDVATIISNVVTQSINDVTNNDNYDKDLLDTTNVTISTVAAVTMILSSLPLDQDNNTDHTNTCIYANNQDDHNDDNNKTNWNSIKSTNTPTTKTTRSFINDNNNEIDFFSKRLQQQSLTDLLENELGEQDPDWQKMVIVTEPTTTTTTRTNEDKVVDHPSHIEEDDQIDQDQKECISDHDHHLLQQQQQQQSTSNSITTTTTSIPLAVSTTPTPTNDNNNKLLMKGKAPIHIEFYSFGYYYGGLPHDIRTKGCGGYQNYTYPLPPFDCRKVLEPIPNHLQWMDGLSGLVRNTLLRINNGKNNNTNNNNGTSTDNYTNTVNTNDDDDDDWNDTRRKDNPSYYHNNIRMYTKTIIAKQVSDCIIDAITNGGYGYSLPLQITIYIGSYYGRHRSVVCCELAASALRGLLRTNHNNQFTQPCSVSCYHRELSSHHHNNNTTTGGGGRGIISKPNNRTSKTTIPNHKKGRLTKKHNNNNDDDESI